MAFDAETKALFDEQAKTFESFKAENDKLQAQVKKLGEDAVTRDAVEKLSKSLDEIADKIKAADKANIEIEAKMNRLSLGSGATEAETKAAREFGEQFGKSDYSAQDVRDYKSAMDKYVRRSDDRDIKTVTLSVGVDPSGGYLVTPDMSGRMVKKVYETTAMRQLANVVQIGADALEGPIDNGEFGASWVGEQEDRTQTDASQLGLWRIPANELYAYPWVTQKLLDDANMDVESWIAGKAADKFSRKENLAFANGTGVRQPKGIFAQTIVATADATRAWNNMQYTPSGAAGDLTSADALIDLTQALKAAYRGNGKFLTNRAMVGKIRKLKDAYGQYLWLPSMQAKQPATLLGYEVVEGEDVPAYAANSYSVAFGDFAECYTIVDRVGVTLIRDNITKPGFVKFIFRKRTGGDVVNYEAVKFLKLAVS